MGELSSVEMEVSNNIEQPWETNWVNERIKVYDRLLKYHPMSLHVKEGVTETRRIFTNFRHNPHQNGIMTLDDLRRLDVGVDVRFARLYEDAATPTTLSKDVKDLREFLSNMLLDEYLTGKVNRVEGDKKWMQRGMYLNALMTDHPQDGIRALAEDLGTSIDDVETLCGVRMQDIIKLSGLDARYVVQRLQAYARDDTWITAIQYLGKRQQWKELARKFLYDQKYLEQLMPGNFEYIDPEVKGSRTNRKGRIRVGMIRKQTTYFSKLTSPESFILSKQVRKMLKADVKRRKRDAKAKARMETIQDAKQWPFGSKDSEDIKPRIRKKMLRIDLPRIGRTFLTPFSLVGDVLKKLVSVDSPYHEQTPVSGRFDR